MLYRLFIFTVIIQILFFSRNSSAQNQQIFISDDVQLLKLSDSLYMHITWDEFENYGRFSSNGLIYIVDGKGLLIDTPMDNEKTKVLYNFFSDSLNVTITFFIAGHFHNDCMGGIRFLKEKGVTSISGVPTQIICNQLGLPIPDISFYDSLNVNFGGQVIKCYYLGGGHSEDNIVVYLEKEKVLFGGCLIKSKESINLGFIGDANLDAWPITIKKVKTKFQNPNLIIPGHGNIGDSSLYNHTLHLLNIHTGN